MAKFLKLDSTVSNKLTVTVVLTRPVGQPKRKIDIVTNHLKERFKEHGIKGVKITPIEDESNLSIYTFNLTLKEPQITTIKNSLSTDSWFVKSGEWFNTEGTELELADEIQSQFEFETSRVSDTLTDSELQTTLHDYFKDKFIVKFVRTSPIDEDTLMIVYELAGSDYMPKTVKDIPAVTKQVQTMIIDAIKQLSINSNRNASKRSTINSNKSILMKGMNLIMKTNITNGMAAENRSRCENSTSGSMARRPMLNSSARRPARPNRPMRRNPLLNSSVRPAMSRTANSNVMNRSAWMKEIGMNCSRMECRDLFGHSKDEMISGTARWDQTLERAYNDYCAEEGSVNSARRPVRRPVLNSSVRRPAMRRPISRPVLNSSARRPLANRPVLNSNRQSLRSVLEKAHAARLNSSLRPMPRRAKLNSSEEDAFDDADFDVTDDTEIIDAAVDNTAEAIPAEEVPTNDNGAVDVTELLIVQDPESKELSLFIQDTEDETLPESVEVIAAVDPATEADLDSSCGGKKKLNSSEEDGAENAAEGADDDAEADADAEKADDTDTAETEAVEIELADGDTVAVDDIYVVQSEDGELDLFIAEEGAELPESVEVVGEAVAVDESEVLDSSRKMIKRGKALNAGKKAGCARLNSDDSADTITDFMGAVRAAGIPAEHIDHWQSDLYLKVTPETTALVNKYRFKKQVTKFIDNIDHEPWYEVPFAYYEGEQLDSSKKLNSGANADKSFKELKETYSWSFKKYPDVSSVIGYKNIGFEQTTYTKQGSKWVEGEKESDNVDWEFYLNTIDAAPFFKNMGGKEKLDVKYTKVGKVPFQVTSINPDGTEKIVRTFNFDSAERKAN